MYHIIIVDSVLAKKIVAINRHTPEGPHLRSARVLGHMQYVPHGDYTGILWFSHHYAATSASADTFLLT